MICLWNPESVRRHAIAYAQISLHAQPGTTSVISPALRQKPLVWVDKIWPIDHGLKMIATYFALASAASGNLISAF